MTQGFAVKDVPTKPYDGQKTGTSGLRKKTEVFTQENYLANWYGVASAPIPRYTRAVCSTMMITIALRRSPSPSGCSR